MNRRVLGAVTSALLAVGTCIAAASPAAADPLPTAHASIGVAYPSPTTFHVCAGGLADGTGDWLFEVNGLRADGSQIHYEQSGFGSSFDTCVYPDISTGGTADGSFEATLSFAHIPPIEMNGVQTNSVQEFVALAGVEVHWTPQQNANGFGM